MVRVGVTGMRDLSGFDVAALKRKVRAHLETLKKGNNRSVMLNSIAAGADQLCAEIGLSLGYELVCPLPFAYYRDDFQDGQRKAYDRLLKRASRVYVVSDSDDKDAAYLAAGKDIVQKCDVLLAVWDGTPQDSICGTVAVMAYANSLGKEVRILF